MVSSESRALPFPERIAYPLCQLPEHPEPPNSKKEADLVEYLEVCDYVGLLVNGPPGTAELPFI